MFDVGPFEAYHFLCMPIETLNTNSISLRPALIVCGGSAWTPSQAAALAATERLIRNGVPSVLACLSGGSAALEAKCRGLERLEFSSFATAPLAIRDWASAHPDSLVHCVRLRDVPITRVGILGFPRIRFTASALEGADGPHIWSPLNRWFFARLDSLIAPGRAQSLELFRAAPVPSGRIRALVSPIDSRRIGADRRSDRLRSVWRLGERDIAIAIVCSGREGDLACEALQSLGILIRNRTNLPWKVAFVPDPAEPNGRDAARRWASDARSKLGHARVIAVDASAAFPETLASADIFVSTSTSPLSDVRLLEAMASGLAALAPQTDRGQDAVGDARVALFWKSGNAWDLARQLERLLGDAALRARLSGLGRAHARSRGDTCRFERDWMEVVSGVSVSGQMTSGVSRAPGRDVGIAAVAVEEKTTVGDQDFLT